MTKTLDELPEKAIRDIANGLNGVQPLLGQWGRDLRLARAVEAAHKAALRELIADRDLLLNAVDLIASWSEGEKVGSHFDEPASAELARKALAQRTKASET